MSADRTHDTHHGAPYCPYSLTRSERYTRQQPGQSGNIDLTAIYAQLQQLAAQMQAHVSIQFTVTLPPTPVLAPYQGLDPAFTTRLVARPELLPLQGDPGRAAYLTPRPEFMPQMSPPVTPARPVAQVGSRASPETRRKNATDAKAQVSSFLMRSNEWILDDQGSVPLEELFKSFRLWRDKFYVFQIKERACGCEQMKTILGELNLHVSPSAPYDRTRVVHGLRKRTEIDVPLPHSDAPQETLAVAATPASAATSYLSLATSTTPFEEDHDRTSLPWAFLDQGPLLLPPAASPWSPLSSSFLLEPPLDDPK